mmetsp:Transcript_7443/g.11847  ORF Transcript_7443/g.11847 Transcript_7443/m.11847 type:complete len:206 (-) Transcript_7443:63-680(-)
MRRSSARRSDMCLSTTSILRPISLLMPSLPLFRVRASFSFEDCLSANISASRVCTRAIGNSFTVTASIFARPIALPYPLIIDEFIVATIPVSSVASQPFFLSWSSPMARLRCLSDVHFFAPPLFRFSPSSPSSSFMPSSPSGSHPRPVLSFFVLAINGFMMPSPSGPSPAPCTYPIRRMIFEATPRVCCSHAPSIFLPERASGLE